MTCWPSLAWRVEFLPSARRDLEKLSPEVRDRIADFLRERIATDLSPRRVGEPLTGRQYKGQWRYRVGDYRLVVRLKDEVLLVTVIKVGHRSAVYR